MCPVLFCLPFFRWFCLFCRTLVLFLGCHRRLVVGVVCWSRLRLLVRLGCRCWWNIRLWCLHCGCRLFLYCLLPLGIVLMLIEVLFYVHAYSTTHTVVHCELQPEVTCHLWFRFQHWLINISNNILIIKHWFGSSSSLKDTLLNSKWKPISHMCALTLTSFYVLTGVVLSS